MAILHADCIAASLHAMRLRSIVPPQALQILHLAREDRSAASRAMGELTLEQQIALVCETPVARRAEVLALAPAPEVIIPRLPEVDLCTTAKSVGLHQAGWILEHATREQIVACVDLDAWRGPIPDVDSLENWLDAFMEASHEASVRAMQAVDPEMLLIYMRERLDVFLRSNDPGWEPPIGAQTVEGEYYLRARRQGDDLGSLIPTLRLLFEGDQPFYQRIMQACIWELRSEEEEWALRWRRGRLQDLGFPDWEDAMAIYTPMDPHEANQIRVEERPLAPGKWRLPVWLPDLPTREEAGHPIFEAASQLDPDERRDLFYAFVGLANKVIVADGLPLGDSESMDQAIDKGASVASLALNTLAERHDIEPVEVLRRVSVDRLFRVGVNLDPSVRPEPRAVYSDDASYGGSDDEAGEH